VTSRPCRRAEDLRLGALVLDFGESADASNRRLSVGEAGTIDQCGCEGTGSGGCAGVLGMDAAAGVGESYRDCSVSNLDGAPDAEGRGRQERGCLSGVPVEDR
jgi:hypothetical protein